MKVKSSNNLISFKKQLVAKAGIIRDGKPLPCNIYTLDHKNPEDRTYFRNLDNYYRWDNCFFKEVIDIDFCSENYPYEFLTIEDEDSDCLGYAEISKEKSSHKDIGNNLKISLLETCPKHASNNGFRKTKYVGETLVAYVVALAKRISLDNVCVPSYVKSAYPFYAGNCGFEDTHYEDEKLIMPKKKFDSLLSQNEQHTKHKIEFTA